MGNPRVLASDEHWGALLWHCVDGGGYTGCPPPPRDAEARGDEAAAVLASLLVNVAPPPPPPPAPHRPLPVLLAT